MNRLSNLNEISLYRLSNPEAYLILDTNVLLLFLIGIYNQSYLENCPLMTDNGKKYTKEHFDLMNKILQRFVGKIIITPHILSEINMLSRKRIKEPHISPLFLKIIEHLGNFNEHSVELKNLLKHVGILVDFGFTDISLVEAALEKKWAILTDERRLYVKFNERIPVIYFSAIVANEIQGF